MSRNRKKTNGNSAPHIPIVGFEQGQERRDAGSLGFLQSLMAIWRAFIAFFAVLVMGIHQRLWHDLFAGTSVGHRVVFDGIAIVASSLAVAAATMVTAYRLLGYLLGSAILLGSVTGLGFYLLDRHMLRLRYQAGATDWRFRIMISAVRLGVLLLMVALGIFSAVNANREAIDTALETQRISKFEVLAADPRYRNQMDAARHTVKLAASAMARQADLQKAVQDKTQQREAALQEYQDQCQGNTSIDGRTRVPVCGPLARGAQSHATSLDHQIAALNAELKAIGPGNDLTSANKGLERIEMQIREEVNRTTSGFPARLRIMLDLIRDDWSVRASAVPWLILTLIPECLLWISYARSVHPALIRLSTIENELLDAGIDAYRRAGRDRLGQRQQPLVIHVPSANQRPTLKAVGA